MNFLKQVSMHSLDLEQSSQGESDLPVSSSEADEKQSGGKDPVTADKRWITIEQKPAPEPDSLTEDASTISREELSIPRDYVEGIREWLASPPLIGEEIQRHRAAEREVFKTPEQADRPPHSRLFDLDSTPQNEIQEFSLSIGSIRIVVEEPAQQPAQQSNSVQPVERAQVTGQPQSRDAFALTRNYFRGF